METIGLFRGIAGAFSPGFRQAIAEFSAGFCGFGEQTLDYFRMCGGNVLAFAGVVSEVVQFGIGNGFGDIGDRFSGIWRFCFGREAAITMWEDEFPCAVTAGHGLELICGEIIPVGCMRGNGLGLVGNERPDIFSINGVGGEFCIGEGSEGWEEIDGHEVVMVGHVCGNVAGPRHNAGDANAAFPDGAFCFAQRASTAAVGAEGVPWAVVSGEDDKGVAGELEFF